VYCVGLLPIIICNGDHATIKLLRCISKTSFHPLGVPNGHYASSFPT